MLTQLRDSHLFKEDDLDWVTVARAKFRLDLQWKPHAVEYVAVELHDERDDSYPKDDLSHWSIPVNTDPRGLDIGFETRFRA